MIIIYFFFFLNHFFQCQEIAPIDKLNLDKCEYDFICDPKNYCSINAYNKKISKICENDNQKITYEINKNIKCKEIFSPSIENKICENCSFGQFRKKINDNISQCEFCPEGTYMDKENHEEIKCIKCDNYISNVKYIYPEVRNFYSFNTIIDDESGTIKIIYEKNNEKLNANIFIEIDGKNRKYIDYIPVIKLNQGNHFIKIKSNNTYFEKIIIFGEKEGSGYKCINNNNIILEKINQCEKLNNEYHYNEKLRSCYKCPDFSYYINKKCHFLNIFQNDFFLVKINFGSFYKKIQNMTLNLSMNNIDYNIDIENHKIYESSNKILIGEELTNIKLLNGKNEKGVILEYKGKRNNNFITSYLYLKCSPHNLLPEISNENVDKTSLGFTILSKDICPVCISSELNFVDSECQQDNFKRNFKNENKLCQFLNIENENKTLILNSSSNIISSDNDDDKVIISLFGIKEKLPINVNNKIDFYLNQTTINIPCIENEINISLILILVFFIIIIFAIIYNCILSAINNSINETTQMKIEGVTYQDVKII